MFTLNRSVFIWGGVLLLVLALLAKFTLAGGPGMTVAEARTAAQAYTSARIYRDEWGMPHISGERDADTAFGLGYAHAEDDWETIQTTLVAARGQLARYQGADAAPTDYIVQLLRIRELVSARYESDLSDETRALIEAYADGLNLYAAENPWSVWSDALPVTGEDIVAGFVLRTPFMYGLDADLAELFADERQRTISMRDTASAFQWLEEARLPFGSNAFAIAPSFSDDGATRLIINSHQPYEGPVAWYEAHLRSGEGWNMVGGTFPGAPLILHGHSENLGWAHTVNLPDLADIYVLETEGDRYLLDGEWRDLERGEARLNVRIFGSLRWTVSEDMWWSEHGPVVRTDHGDYAIRYSGMEEIRQVEQWYRMNRAGNFAEWMEAMEMGAISSLNAVYADRFGEIAYLFNAAMPVREEGWNWREYLPGDRSELIWQDYHPISAMPLYHNPDAGWLLSANQTPFDATVIAENLNPERFSATFGIEPRMTNRAHRGLELLRSERGLSAERLEAIKFDRAYSEVSAVGRLVREILAMDFSSDPQLLEAQRLLGRWDMSTDVDSRAAALGVLTAVRCIGNRHHRDPWLMDPATALSEAAAELMTHYGRLDPQWGEVNRMVRGDVDMPLGGGPDVMRAVYGANDGLDADGRIRAVAGDTYIMSVEWLADGSMTSRSIHQYGTATMDEASPHFDDQAVLFAEEAWRDLALDWSEQGYSPLDQ
ncbi:MAG: hypothetical protein GYB36_10835 [Alphaproteobacteria bacterium]|nr:hypothetical protein [Alphaproteobacteria bacterium]